MIYEAFFFDFDGVLVDSVEVKTKAFAHLFEPYGKDIVDFVVNHHRDNGGMTRKDKFRYYYQHLLKKPLDDIKLANLCNEFANLVVEEVISAPVIHGAEEFLEYWQRKVMTFVISGTPAEEIQQIVYSRGWTKYFHEVCGAPVSKEVHLGRILNQYSLQIGNCIFFGDAKSDHDAAKACKIPFIGILPDQNAPLLKFVPGIKWARDFKSLTL